MLQYPQNLHATNYYTAEDNPDGVWILLKRVDEDAESRMADMEDPEPPSEDLALAIDAGPAQGGGKGVQPFSPDGPLTRNEDGLFSDGSTAVLADEAIRAMHNKADNVMTERCRCRTRPCRCRHTAVAGFTRDGDKKGARKRNKVSARPRSGYTGY